MLSPTGGGADGIQPTFNTQIVGTTADVSVSLYDSTRVTPTATILRWRSGTFRRAFSDCALDMKGFDSGVKLPIGILEE